jgi:hypothetical protein
MFLFNRSDAEPPKVTSLTKFLPDGLPESSYAPGWLVSLGLHIFERLPVAERLQWREQFINSLPSNLSERGFQKLKYAFLHFWVERQHSQMNKSKYPRSEAAVMGVLVLLKRAHDGGNVSQEDWLLAKENASYAREGCSGSVAYAAEEGAMAAAYNAAAASLVDFSVFNCRLTVAASKSANQNITWKSTYRPSAGYVSYSAAAARLERRGRTLHPVIEADVRIQRDWLIKAMHDL